MKLVPIETLIEKSREYVLKKDAEPFPWFVIEAEDFDKAIKIAKKWKNVDLVEKLVKQKQEIADKPVGENDRGRLTPNSWVQSLAKELDFRKTYKNKSLIREEFTKAFPFFTYYSRENESYFEKFFSQILNAYEEYKSERNYYQLREHRLATLEGFLIKGQSLETEEGLDLVLNNLIEHKDWKGYAPPNELPVIKQVEESSLKV